MHIHVYNLLIFGVIGKTIKPRFHKSGSIKTKSRNHLNYYITNIVTWQRGVETSLSEFSKS